MWSILRGIVPAALLLSSLTLAPAAETYPTRAVRIIVGFGPGSSGDVVSRSVSTHMSQVLGQQVVVENRPGAGSNVAAQLVARSPADG